MFFRNLAFFRFSPILGTDLLHAATRGELDQRLQDSRAKPVGPMELTSQGFVSPFGADEQALYHLIGGDAGCLWFTVGGEQRVLPPAAVDAEARKRVAEIEAREGKRLGGRARKRIKDEVLVELLPRALVKPYRINAYLDLARGVLAVDTVSRRTAERVATELRHAIGSFPALPLNAEVAPRAILTGWLAGEPLPDGLALGDECELKDGLDKGAVVKCQRQELIGDEIANHLAAGKQCSRLALVLDEHVSFVFGEDLIVRKLRFLDDAVQALENTERDSLHAELDARFALMSGEFGRLFDTLEAAFRLSKVEG